VSIDLIRIILGMPSGPGVLYGLRWWTVSLIRRLLKNLMLGRGGGYSKFAGTREFTGGGGKKDEERALTLSALVVAVEGKPFNMVLSVGMQGLE